MAILWMVVVFTCFVYSSQNEDFVKESNIYMQHAGKFLAECLNENVITMEMLKEFQHYEKLVTDERFKCFIYCMSMKPGIVDTNGALNIDFVSSTFEITDKNVLNKINSNCKTLKVEEICSAAQHSILCMFEALNIRLE